MPSNDVIVTAVKCLREGGLIAYPTESVYGLGCDPGNEGAVRRILALKQRALGAGLILVGGEFGHLLPYLGRMPDEVVARLVASWPAPLTWVVPASRKAPGWITGNRDSIAVRIPDHAQARALCTEFNGALVSTSANTSGKRGARTAEEVLEYFPTGIDYVLRGETGGRELPSEIRDAMTNEVLRPGTDD